jgi:glycosyltransferase involved in cell wall biosynthesis
MTRRPLHVAQVVENLHRGAVERWLVEVFLLARVSRPELNWTFLCTLDTRGDMEKLVTEHGGRTVHLKSNVRQLGAFLGELRQTLIALKCDILHSQHDVMSGIYLLAAVGLPIRKRIIHVHNTACGVPLRPGFKRALFRAFCRKISLRLADQIVGVSHPALCSLTGHQRQSDSRVIHCGIHLNQFSDLHQARSMIRSELGIPADAQIVLFVGRLDPHKNPMLALEIFSKIRASRSNIYAVFAGDGPLSNNLRERALTLGLEKCTKLLGRRTDVAVLMGAADLLLWPGDESQTEGLGLVAVEAQAAGLPLLVSRNIPVEAFVVAELCHQLPLQAGIEAWAKTAVQILQGPKADSNHCRLLICNSSFSMEQSARATLELLQI